MPSGARCLIEISWTGLAFPRSLTSVLSLSIMARAGKNFTAKPSKKGKHDKKLKDQVLALGGTEGDYDLVKDADKEPTAGKGTAEDVCLKSLYCMSTHLTTSPLCLARFPSSSRV